MEHPGKRQGRQSERIRRYICSFGENANSGKPVKLPPIRHIANELGVSTATIYHVYKKLSHEGYLETSVGHGSYLKPPQKSRQEDSLCIGLNWSGESGQTVSRAALISEGIFKAAAACDRRLNIRPLPQGVFDDQTHSRVLLGEVEVIDALIYSSTVKEFGSEVAEIFRTYEAHGKPIVRLDPADVNLTENFVTADNFRVARHCGYAFSKSGRRRVAYLARESLNATVSTLNTLIGLQAGVALGGIPEGPVTPVFSERIEESCGYDAIKAFLKTHKVIPDAVYCFGDLLALGALRAFKEAGIGCPEEVSIIGGTGYSFSGTVFDDLTRVKIPFDIIGARLIEMVIRRIDQRCQSVPAIYVPGTVQIAKTTTVSENELLSRPLPTS